ncbi:hypothetical protein BH23PLA1_BH23PLA1_18930 [soil metagenome]
MSQKETISPRSSMSTSTSTRFDLTLVGRARLPLSGLSALAHLRAREGISVRVEGDRAWISWKLGDEIVPRALLPVPDVEFYVFEAGQWYRSGSRLPSFNLPSPDPSVPLNQALTPLPTRWEDPKEGWAPVRLRLTRDDRPRQATALRCQIAELLEWADSVPTTALSTLRAALGEDRVLLIGANVPAIVGGDRFWGERVLVPMGFRTKPALSEGVLAEALRAEADDLVLIHARGAELVPRSAFRPLTRAGVRLALALEEAGP